MPDDLANGLLPVLLKNLGPDGKARFSFLAATPQPRLVSLEISKEGQDAFSIGGAERVATRYRIQVVIGGLRGALAPLVGKQPPDIRLWVSQGEAPAFLKFEGQLFPDFVVG